METMETMETTDRNAISRAKTRSGTLLRPARIGFTVVLLACLLLFSSSAARAALELTLSPAKGTVTQGGTATFRATVTNTGTTAIRLNQISVAFDNGDQADIDPSAFYDGFEGELAAGASISFRTLFTVTAEPTAAPATYNGTVQILGGATMDSLDNLAQRDFSLTIERNTKPPVIAPISDVSASEGGTFTGPTPSLTEGALPVSWTLSSAPAGMTIDQQTGIVSWSPVSANPEGHLISIRATNEFGSDTASFRLFVAAGYVVTIRTETTEVSAGMPIVLVGRAQYVADGTPAANVNVAIRFRVRGFINEQITTTNASGNFGFTYIPRIYEAGITGVGASHPAVTGFSEQDSFKVFGIGPKPEKASVTVIPDIPLPFEVTFKNYGDMPLHDLTATLKDTLPEVISGTLEAVPNTIAGETTFTVRGTLNAPPTQTTDFTRTLQVEIRTREGAIAALPLNVTIKPPKPELQFDPAKLVANPVRGQQTLVEMVVKNTGGKISSPLDIALPRLDWLSTVTPNPTEPLPPGGVLKLGFALKPPGATPLIPVEGNIAVANNLAYGRLIPFRLTPISTTKGKLTVSVVDETTFYSSGEYQPVGGPLLVGANIRLINPFENNAVVVEATSSSPGQPTVLSDIPEGSYLLEVIADNHSKFTSPVEVKADEPNPVIAFLSRESLRYTWQVTPTEIPDVTVTTLEAVFETNVPRPVVTVSPPLIDLAKIQGCVTQVYLTVTNHGLIAAQNARLNLPSHPNWKFTPLVDSLGDIPALGTRLVPVLIERLDCDLDGSPKGPPIANAANGPCELTWDLTYELICVGTNLYRVPVMVLNASGDCNSPGLPGGGGGGG
ncbi:MAG: putative Ig domain-containing protein, partial [Capsulimonadales bacterium]|nr:putative Ig domain-containing protein [Capsulimonadales bacterium]